ncbi:MAG: hypothetical protein Q9214_005486, partial [Letrouitia sp. 1 TL-2023]
MRLIKDEGQGNLRLMEYHEDETPRYAILSHTWGADDEEVTYKDFLKGKNKEKFGWKKIEFCREQAKVDRMQHFWIDTCCIDKTSSVELSEAINSMFHWEGKEKALRRLQEEIRKAIEEHPKTSQLPLPTVPFRRDVNFVDQKSLHARETLLELEEKPTLNKDQRNTFIEALWFQAVDARYLTIKAAHAKT